MLAVIELALEGARHSMKPSERGCGSQRGGTTGWAVPTRGGAVSYFVGGSIGEDKGFVIVPWTAVRFDNHNTLINADSPSCVSESAAQAVLWEGMDGGSSGAGAGSRTQSQPCDLPSSFFLPKYQ